MALQGPEEWLAIVLGGMVAAWGVAFLWHGLLRDRSRGRCRCPRCWYDLAAHASSLPITCPECGRRITRQRSLHRTRRRYRPALLGLAFLLLGTTSVAWPWYRDEDWKRWLPDTILIALLGHVDADWPVEELYRRAWAGRSGIEVGGANVRDRRIFREWQWRWLTRRAAELGASDAPFKRRSEALGLVVIFSPTFDPALPYLLKALDDPDQRIRFQAAWGLKMNRWQFSQAVREQILAALQAALPSANERTTEAIDAAITSLRDLKPPAAEASNAALTPESIQQLLHGGTSATLGVIFRRLGVDPRALHGPYGGESGPYDVQRLNMELDGRPGEDCILLIADSHKVHGQALVLLNRGPRWLSPGTIDLYGPYIAWANGDPHIRVLSGEGQRWLVCGSRAGSTPGPEYILRSDIWIRVTSDGLWPAMSIFSSGHAKYQTAHPQGNPVNWTLHTSEPRILKHRGRTAVEYDIDAAFTAGWSQAWSADPLAEQARGQALFTRRETARYFISGRHLIPDPSTPLASETVMERLLLSSPDEFLKESVSQLSERACTASPELRTWLHLYLSLCAPSFERDLVAEALSQAERHD